MPRINSMSKVLRTFYIFVAAVIIFIVPACSHPGVMHNGPQSFGLYATIGDLMLSTDSHFIEAGNLGSSEELASFLNLNDAKFDNGSHAGQENYMSATYQVAPVTSEAGYIKTIYAVATEVTGVTPSGIKIYGAAVLAFRVGSICNLIRLVPRAIPATGPEVWGSRQPYTGEKDQFMAEVQMPPGGCVPEFNVSKGLGKWGPVPVPPWLE